MSLPGNHEGLVTFTSEGHKGDHNGTFFNIIGNSIRAKNVVKIAPKLTMIPNAFHNVSAELNNNVFSLGPFHGGTYTIPDGHYTLFNLLVQMNTMTYNAGNPGLEGVLWQPGTFPDGTPRVFAENKSNLAPIALLTWPENSKFPELIGASTLPTALPFGNPPYAFELPPNVGSVVLVHLLCPEMAGNQHVDEKGRTQSVLETVPMAATPYGAYAIVKNDSVDLNTIDFDFPQDLSKINFHLVGPNFKQLTLPKNAHIYVQCRIWSTDK